MAAIKLNKDEKVLLAQYVISLEAEYDTVMNAEVVGEELQELVDAYNAHISTVQEFVNNTAERLRGEFEGKSEKWQEGDAGEATNSFIEDWENLILEEATLEDADEVTVEDQSSSLGDLPEEPEL